VTQQNDAPNIPVKPLISIITPLFNEENGIPALAGRLCASLSGLDCRWEWIAVDDGSADGTYEQVGKAVTRADEWQVIRLSRNFGQQSAYRAGLEAAKGDAVVFLDADLQDPPELIPELIRTWRDGAKQVIGVRTARQEKGVRGLCMKAFHIIFHKATGGVMPANSGTFGLIDRELVSLLGAMPERNMFLPAQRGWLGFQPKYVYYKREARLDEPKQSYKKLIEYAWNGITSFSAMPLHAIWIGGLLVCAISLFYAVSLVAIKSLQLLGYFSNLQVPGFTTLAVAVMFFGGIQLLAIGVIGSYLAKLFIEVKRRPLYVTRSKEGGQSNESR
jgi:glycosyltransferase involved in cell wall biosynthesis